MRIAFVGDVMLGGEYVPYARSRGLSLLSAFDQVRGILADAEIVCGNLEGPLNQNGDTRTGVSAILSSIPELVRLFETGPPCVMNLANNHIMDYGRTGLERTVDILSKAGIRWVGAGSDRQEAMRPAVVESKGRRVAFLGFTSGDRHVGSVISSDVAPGCAAIFPLDQALRAIEQAKRETGAVCVLLHWGYEFYSYPSPEQVYVARAVADAGADVIVGHHPHTIQGMEINGTCLILYSLGDFFLPAIRALNGRLQHRKRSSLISVVAKVSLPKVGTPAVEIAFSRVGRHYQIVPFRASRQDRFKKTLSQLSLPICSGDFRDFWQNYKTRRERELLWESLLEAVIKVMKNSPATISRTVSLNDFKRNLIRFAAIMGMTRGGK